MFTVQECSIPAVKLIKPKLFHDKRGFVCELTSERHLETAGINGRFVQENMSFSKTAGTVRGLHFQAPPHAQAKMLRVVRGRIFDVAVDVRAGSPTFGQHVSMTLDEADVAFFYIPRGFAHGFCTLTDDVTVLYKVDAFYAPESERGIRWDDPALKINWPVDPSKAIVADKDMALPAFCDLSPLTW